MCPLQIINDIEHLPLTLHGLNRTFIYHPSNVKNYSIDHKLEMGQPKKRGSSKLHIFTPLCKNFGLKYKTPIATKIGELFRHLGNWHLMAHQMAVIWSKIQNRLSRTPSAPPMDRFLMDNLNNKCALTPCECTKKVVLDF